MPTLSKVDVSCRTFKELKLGVARDRLKEEAFIESYYDQRAARKKKERDVEVEKKDPKKNVKVFGYKHPKVVRFMGLLLRCLKDCYD